jgi:hypothetical protein
MVNKKERRAAVRFCPATFKRLPIEEKLAYLRAAFKALGSGQTVADDRTRAPRRPVVDGATRDPIVPQLAPMLSKAEFDRLTLDQKLAYLSRAHRNLRAVARKWGRTPLPN